MEEYYEEIEQEGAQITHLRDADGKLLRLIIDLPDTANGQEAINANPSAVVDGFPLPVIDLDFNEGALGQEMIMTGDKTLSTYQEDYQPASYTNLASTTRTAKIVDTEFFGSGNTKSLELTPDFPRQWSIDRLWFGRNIQVDGYTGNLWLDKSEVEVICKFPQRLDVPVRFYGFHAISFLMHSKNGKIRYRAYDNYPNSSKSRWVQVAVNDPYGWHKWSMTFDRTNFKVDVKLDGNFFASYNPGIKASQPAGATRFQLTTYGANRTITLDANDKVYIQSIKAWAHSQLKTNLTP